MRLKALEKARNWTMNLDKKQSRQEQRHSVLYIVESTASNQSLTKLISTPQCEVNRDPSCDELHVSETNLVHQYENSSLQERLSPPRIVQQLWPNLQQGGRACFLSPQQEAPCALGLTETSLIRNRALSGALCLIWVICIPSVPGRSTIGTKGLCRLSEGLISILCVFPIICNTSKTDLHK